MDRILQGLDLLREKVLQLEARVPPQAPSVPPQRQAPAEEPPQAARPIKELQVVKMAPPTAEQVQAAKRGRQALKDQTNKQVNPSAHHVTLVLDGASCHHYCAHRKHHRAHIERRIHCTLHHNMHSTAFHSKSQLPMVQCNDQTSSMSSTHCLT